MFDKLFQQECLLSPSIYIFSPHALFVVNRGMKRNNTILMDKYLTVRYKDKTFKASKRLVDFFYDNLSFDL